MQSNFRIRLKKTFDQIVYKSAPLNRLLRNVNKLLSPLISFKIRPFGVLSVRMSSGIVFKLATNETSSVTKLLFWNGADNYEYSRIFERLAKKCNVFVDIGANLGYYTLLAVHSNPSLKSFAFEPANAPFEFLKKNLEINQVTDRAEAFKIALADRAGSIEFLELKHSDNHFSQSNLGGTGRISGRPETNPEFVSTHVAADTMDHFFLSHDMKFPDLIKMDTEGSEGLILEGSRHILSSARPIIICETLYNVIESSLEKIMKEHGYSFYNFKNDKLFHTPTIIRDTDDGVRDCFFVHPDKTHLIKEFIDQGDYKS